MLGIQQVIATLIVYLQVGDVCGIDGASRLRVEEGGRRDLHTQLLSQAVS